MKENKNAGNLLGIGVDIESIERFRELRENKRFLSKVYTEKELEYCFSDQNTVQHLAARFAGKEATIKALSSLGKKIDFKDIEILNKKGVPCVDFSATKYINAEAKISLAHNEDNAIAFVVVTGED